MIAFVICMNDSIEGVVLEDEQKALTELEKLSDIHFMTFSHGYSARQEYNDAMFWHLHETEVH